MSNTVADHIDEPPRACGVQRVFGTGGDRIVASTARAGRADR